jgi:hypothetical protein
MDAPLHCLSAGITFRTGKHDNVPIGIANPNLAVIGCGVEMWLLDYLGFDGSDPLHCCFEGVGLKPEQHAVTVWRTICILEVRVVVAAIIPLMEL